VSKTSTSTYLPANFYTLLQGNKPKWNRTRYLQMRTWQHNTCPDSTHIMKFHGQS